MHASDATTADAALRPGQPPSFWQRQRLPILIFLLSLAIFSAFAGPRMRAPSPNNHFVYLADAWLKGSLELPNRPPHHNDWASVDTLHLRNGDSYRGIWRDRQARRFLSTTGELYAFDASELAGMRTERTYYVSFPPMPSVLMLPGVAIWGMRFNDVWFTVAFAAANVALFFVLLRRLSAQGRSRLSRNDNLWMTALFGFGTAHLWCSVLGAVWFTALIVGVTFTLLYMLASLGARAPFLAGLWLACAFAARTPLVYSVVFFAWFFFFPDGRLRKDWGKRFWIDGLTFVAAPLVVGVALLIHNYYRFDSFSEFGHRYLAAGQIPRIRDYGLFNVHFLSTNLTALLALVPKFLPEAPWVQISKHGLAIWFTTPPLLYFLAAGYSKEVAARTLQWAALATLAVIALPHLLYQNTGWVQFGYRFSLDYLAYLLVLLILGRSRLTWPFKVLIVVAILINAFGAVTFDRMPRFYGDWLLEA